MEKNFKQYVAVISQSSIDDPTVVSEIENDFGPGLKWSRRGPGVYELKSEAALPVFPQKRTITNVQKSSIDTDPGMFSFGHESADPVDETKLSLKQFAHGGGALESFTQLQVSVTVYNKARK